MKRLLTAAMAIAATIIICSCGKTVENTPKGVVKAAFEYVQDEDYDKFWELVYYPNEAEGEARKAEYNEMIEKKENLKILSYKITTEYIEPNGKNAKVYVEDVEYEGRKAPMNGEFNLYKDENGNWRLHGYGGATVSTLLRTN